jgi:hypothetical protein
MNAVEGDLLGARQNIVEAVDEQGPPGVDGHHSRIGRHLEVLQLNRQAWQTKKSRSCQERGFKKQEREFSLEQ